MTPDEFRSLGHRLIDWIADCRSTLAECPVMARTAPGEVRDRLRASPPERPEGFEAVFRDLDVILVPGLSHWQHPHFFGYFPANASLASVLGDCLSTGLGVLGLSWQSSPAPTELEEVVADWVRQMVGLSAGWSGVLQDTPSASTLVALVCARERSTDPVITGHAVGERDADGQRGDREYSTRTRDESLALPPGVGAACYPDCRGEREPHPCPMPTSAS
jgi:aromatic-L-amino-acid decarboxylase